MKAKKVFKYATGEAIPEGAIYLSTQVEKEVSVIPSDWFNGEKLPERHLEKNVLVWHYFLVEVED